MGTTDNTTQTYLSKICFMDDTVRQQWQAAESCWAGAKWSESSTLCMRMRERDWRWRKKNNNQSKKYFKMCPNLVKRLIFPYLHWPSLSLFLSIIIHSRSREFRVPKASTCWLRLSTPKYSRRLSGRVWQRAGPNHSDLDYWRVCWRRRNIRDEMRQKLLHEKSGKIYGISYFTQRQWIAWVYITEL